MLSPLSLTKKPLALAVALACFAPSVHSQELEETIIVGQRGLITSAIAKQRDADTVSSVITNDVIGNLPDQNVAEAVRRLPGVNVLNDQGEGRFISVRGLDPELNTATVNGVQLPAPESDTRAVALDVIPSELVDSIEVIKSLTPEMDAGTLGATIRINTISATEREDFIKVNLAGSYNDLNEENSPEVGIDFSHRISDRVGIAGGFQYSNRKTSTDNIEMDGWEQTDEGIVYAEAVEYRDYDVERDRTGVSLTLDFMATENTDLYARGMYSKFDDTEFRRRLVFEMDEAPSSGTNSSATFLSDDGEISVRRGLKDRFESQEITSLELGGETRHGVWVSDYSFSLAEASEHEYRSQDPTRFRNDFDGAGDLAVTFDYSDLELPTFDVTSATFDDPSVYLLDKVEEIDGLAKDEETTWQYNLAREFNLANGVLEVKAGTKLRQREKNFDVTLLVLEDYLNDGYSLADVPGRQSYGLLDLGVLPDVAAVRAFNNSNRDNFTTIEEDFVEGTLEAFSVNEDITAAYVQGRFENEQMMVIGGLRFEDTENELQGNLVDTDAEVATPQNFSNSYDNLLPSITLKYNLNEQVVLRAATYQSLVRPKLSKLAPRFEINEDGEAAFGNPYLQPYEANNLDFSAEYYFAEAAVIQAGIFFKDIDNFIVDREYDDTDAPYFGSYNGISFVEAEVPENGDSASVQGLELAYNQAFDNGMLWGINYTYTDAEGDIDDRTIPLPASSEVTWNVMAGYENDLFSARLTAAYRDEYLDELGGSADEDRYVKDHMQLDFTGNYKYSENTEFYLKLINLTDEPYIAYQKGPEADRLLQYEEYSFTAKLGMKVRF
jgi:TonB-dependent receptor